jgi:signal peptidase I
VCPNCGRGNQNIDTGTIQRGERVLVDHLAYRWRSPRRWEVAAIRGSGPEDALQVKRVVGLPGEQITIRRGDLYVDGQLVRKTLSDLRGMAILVHDAAYYPGQVNRLASRWRPESSSSQWSQHGGLYRFGPGTDATSAADWLTYHNWQCIKGPWPRTKDYPVLDSYGYNQGISRQLHQTVDLLLVCRAALGPGDGSLRFRIHNGYAWFEIGLFVAARNLSLFSEGRCLAKLELPHLDYAHGVTIEIAICDRQLLASIEGKPVLSIPWKPMRKSPAPIATPLQVGASQIAVTIPRLRVFRDIHYLDPHGLGQTWNSPRRLGPEDYFVIGDNVPISRDSRHQTRGGIPRQNLLGPVYCRW